MFNISRWMRKRKTVNELRRLTDRDLADIGLNRGDLDRWVKQNI